MVVRQSGLSNTANIFSEVCMHVLTYAALYDLKNSVSHDQGLPYFSHYNNYFIVLITL